MPPQGFIVRGLSLCLLKSLPPTAFAILYCAPPVPISSKLEPNFRLVPTGFQLVSDWFQSDSDSKWNQLVLKQILIRTAWNDRNPQEWAGIHRNEQYVLFLGIFLVFFLIFTQYFTLSHIFCTDPHRILLLFMTLSEI